jgi:hypothetical protein
MARSRLDSNARLPIWLRVMGIVLGILFVVWLPFEETSITITVVLAGSICTWVVLRFLVKSLPRSGLYVVWGIIGGLSTGPMTLGLMMLKSGAHAHGVAEFHYLQVRNAFAATPYYALGGFVLGLALYYIQRSRIKH